MDAATIEKLCRRLRDAVERLPAGLRDHVFRVEEESTRLADEHKVDIGLARIAALGHDLARAEPDERLLAMAVEYGLVPDDVEKAEPILIHGPIATRVLAREYKLDYGEILDGIAAHTTARPGMTSLEKVLFLADKIEIDKVERRPAWQEVRELAPRDLDGALRRFLDLHLAEAIQRGWHIHPRTVAARNELLT
jgi:predicted HD superfamily hydrolase involved in NAD metabolism